MGRGERVPNTVKEKKNIISAAIWIEETIFHLNPSLKVILKDYRERNGGCEGLKCGQVHAEIFYFFNNSLEFN